MTEPTVTPQPLSSPFSELEAALAAAVRSATPPAPAPDVPPALTLEQQRATVRGHMQDHTDQAERMGRYRAAARASDQAQPAPPLSLDDKRVRVRELMDGASR